MIKVSGIRHNRAKQSDTRIDWMISQKIYIIYCDNNNKEESNAVMLLAIMSENI